MPLNMLIPGVWISKAPLVLSIRGVERGPGTVKQESRLCRRGPGVSDSLYGGAWRSSRLTDIAASFL